jgi:hypothetical protein
MSSGQLELGTSCPAANWSWARYVQRPIGAGHVMPSGQLELGFSDPRRSPNEKKLCLAAQTDCGYSLALVRLESPRIQPVARETQRTQPTQRLESPAKCALPPSGTTKPAALSLLEAALVSTYILIPIGHLGAIGIRSLGIADRRTRLSTPLAAGLAPQSRGRRSVACCHPPRVIAHYGGGHLNGILRAEPRRIIEPSDERWATIQPAQACFRCKELDWIAHDASRRSTERALTKRPCCCV